MDPVQHSSVNLISVSPLVADAHEAAHVTVGLSSIPEAGQGLGQKKMESTLKVPVALLWGTWCISGD